jgi:hypothetical protein
MIFWRPSRDILRLALVASAKPQATQNVRADAFQGMNPLVTVTHRSAMPEGAACYVLGMRT